MKGDTALLLATNCFVAGLLIGDGHLEIAWIPLIGALLAAFAGAEEAKDG